MIWIGSNCGFSWVRHLPTVDWEHMCLWWLFYDPYTIRSEKEIFESTRFIHTLCIQKSPSVYVLKLTSCYVSGFQWECQNCLCCEGDIFLFTIIIVVIITGDDNVSKNYKQAHNIMQCFIKYARKPNEMWFILFFNPACY